jgi:outer membrane protein assembly factor BamB
MSKKIVMLFGMAFVAILFVISSCATDGDVLFYRQGTGELGWICLALAESTGYVYLGFAYESEEPTHTGSSVMCWDRDGNEVWNFPISNTNQPCGGFTLNAAEDRLYFGTYEQPSHMYCVNALTGAVIWQSRTSLGWPNDTRRFGASPALSPDETVLYCGSGGEVWDPPYDQRFYACNAL